MKSKHFLWLYGLLFFFELILCSTEPTSPIRYFSKLSLTLLLALYVTFKYLKNKKSNIYLLSGLAFSFVGDLLLIQNENYFIAGLLAFFCAHIMYIIRFFNARFIDFKRVLTASVFLLAYTFPLLCLIIPEVGELLPYIILYVAVLMVLVKTMYLRFDFVNKNSYIFGLLGSVIYVLSDSILAIDKFLIEVPFGQVMIMFTYGIAQYLIVKAAVVEQINEKNYYRFIRNHTD